MILSCVSSQLDQTGVYQFKVKVIGSDQAYGFAFINVTVVPGKLQHSVVHVYQRKLH